MSSYTTHLIDKFQRSGILIDTNLLLLLAVGRFDHTIIESGAFNRLAEYEISDYVLVEGLVSLFAKHLTTAHVLAEVSNWIGYLSSTREQECLSKLRTMLPTFEELHMDSFGLSTHDRFRFLGFTDTGLLTLASDYLVVTDDLRFAKHIHSLGLDALNINHIRPEAWLAADRTWLDTLS